MEDRPPCGDREQRCWCCLGPGAGSRCPAQAHNSFLKVPAPREVVLSVMALAGGGGSSQGQAVEHVEPEVGISRGGRGDG